MLPEPGHLLPTFRLAHALVRQGHRVRYITIEKNISFIKSRGFDCIPLLVSLIPATEQRGSFMETVQAMVHLAESLDQKCLAMGLSVAEAICADLKGIQTDLFFIDSALGYMAGNIVEILRHRFMRLSVTFTELYEVLPRPSAFKRLPEIVLCPKEFDIPDAPAVAHQRWYVEPSIFENREENWSPLYSLDKKKRLAYCTFGTQSSAYKRSRAIMEEIARAFSRLPDYQLIIAVGGHLDSAQFEKWGSNIFAFRSVPQLEVLKLSSIAITHGGLGTVKEAIMAAVPMLVFPFDYDQPMNAKRVEHHCLGQQWSSETISADAIGQTIENICNSDSIVSSAKQMQSVFRFYEEDMPSIRLIASCLQRRVSRNRFSIV